MEEFGHFYLDKEKDLVVDLFREGDELHYVLRTPNHGTGNLIANRTQGVHTRHRKDPYEPDQGLWPGLSQDRR